MNRLRIFTMVFFYFFCFQIYSQNWQVSWDKQLGNSKMDYFTDVITDISGGYTVLGATIPRSKKSYDFWLVRYNEKGDTIWTKTYGTDLTEIPKKLLQTPDGSYLILGVTKDSVAEKPVLIRTDREGVETWQKGFNDGKYYLCEDIVFDGEKEFLIAGSKSDDKEIPKRWIAKLDENGEAVWEKSFQTDLRGFCKAAKKLPDGSYAISGKVEKQGQKDCDVWITRLDKNGTSVWETYLSNPKVKSWPECVCCSPDSFLMVVGWQGLCLNDINSSDPVFDFDLAISKIDKKGKLVWTKNYNREGSEGGNSVAIRPDGSFVIAGIKSTSFLGKVGPWLLWVDAEGKEKGENLIKYHCNNDQAVKIINSNDGGIVVIGPGLQDAENTRANGWIMKFSGL